MITKAGRRTHTLTQLLANRVKDEASLCKCEQERAFRGHPALPFAGFGPRRCAPSYTFIHSTCSELRQKPRLPIEAEGHRLP